MVFKLNAGKNTGSYNLTRRRHIAGWVDKALWEVVGLSDLWEEFELEHSVVVRTPYEDEVDK